jgi:hypothetical protein
MDTYEETRKILRASPKANSNHDGTYQSGHKTSKESIPYGTIFEGATNRVRSRLRSGIMSMRPQMYRILGEAYVHKVMDGQLMDTKLEIEAFEIC